MGRIFNIDGPLMSGLNKVANLMILNFCFIISCIPLVTIGAGFTALYTVNLKMVRNEESYIFRSFWKAFKDNFVQGTIAWLVCLVVGYIFYIDFRLANLMSSQMSTFFRIALFMILFIFVMLVLYLFPYIARFKDKLRVCIKNAFLISVANVGYSLIMLVLLGACLFITFYDLRTLMLLGMIWFLIGFALISFANSWLLRRVFQKYEPEADTGEGDYEN